MWRPLSHPATWLLVQAACVFWLLLVSGGLTMRKVDDTKSYIEAAGSTSLTQALSGHRTPGYPLFLKALGLEREDQVEGRYGRHAYRIVRKAPKVEALVFLAAIFLFWYATKVYLGSSWLAFALAVPLAHASIWKQLGRIQPDFLSAGLALASISLTLLLVKRPRSAFLWSAVCLGVLATYLVRPGYLFLVPLIPLALASLSLLEGRSLRRCVALGLGALAVTALPYLLYCGLRYALVRDFSVAPFGGTNQVGISAMFLDESVVRRLPRHQRLARRLLLKREAEGLVPMPLGEDSVQWYGQHNQNVWEIALPLARRWVLQGKTVLGDGTEPRRDLRIEVNQLLTELSFDTIKLKPFHYLQWLRDGVIYCADKAFESAWVRWPAILLALSLPIGYLLPARRKPRSPADRESEARGGRLLALVGLALAFFLAQTLLILLVDVPYDRFVYGSILLLPSALCGMLFEIWRSMLGPEPRPFG